MAKQIISAFEKKCIDIIKRHDVEMLSNLIQKHGITRLESYGIMYDVCKIGCFESFKVLTKEGIKPDITSVEWAASGRNEHQKDIFDYIVNVYKAQPFYNRSYATLRFAAKSQRRQSLETLLSICIKGAKKNNRIESLAKSYLGAMEIAAKYNQASAMECFIENLDNDETLFLAINDLLTSRRKQSINSFVNQVIIPNVIKKRNYDTLAVLADRYEIAHLKNSETLIKKSYDDDKITRLFHSLPIMERHGLLKGMVETGKSNLAISLFNEIPQDSISCEPESLARLLNPVIKAYNIDPISFFERDDVPDNWLPALAILVSE